MPRARPRAAILILLASAVALTGCNKTMSSLTPGSSLNTASTTPVSLDALAELGEKWQSNPKDVNKGLAYANGLESVGQKDEALTVYQKLYESAPGNAKVAGLYGRKLVSAGKADRAVPILEAAERGDTDWRIMSALGTAYDQQGLYQKAREQYAKALAADPQNLAVMNNLAMSYALEGNLKQAETELRAADALPRSKSEPRIRQNLALVVGLQGRFDEATKLAQQDLPPEQVQENMAYLKKMLSQPNTWQQISAGGNQG
ncbi:pilus assembly protein TadD [Aestuariivirga litoralis]|uniref:Pilus assembly protein TadD n=1 Tax=Aestuariivirga litoralis TaxID=2650924 RepID=A0A2W2AU01_9HYPH|nr:tetratricopeptide repeat protein [Aestuariivirga litoralis]PZF78711.1 pilus assembly protein TadD [Aestuariivirga litoralis]